MAITHDSMTPYEFACLLAMQGLLSGEPRLAHCPYELAADAIRSVDALFDRLKQNEDAKK